MADFCLSCGAWRRRKAVAEAVTLLSTRFSRVPAKIFPRETTKNKTQTSQRKVPEEQCDLGWWQVGGFLHKLDLPGRFPPAQNLNSVLLGYPPQTSLFPRLWFPNLKVTN